VNAATGPIPAIPLTKETTVSANVSNYPGGRTVVMRRIERPVLLNVPYGNTSTGTADQMRAALDSTEAAYREVYKLAATQAIPPGAILVTPSDRVITVHFTVEDSAL